MKELNIRELEVDELEAGTQLLARGMCDNPNNVQAFGPDRARRERALARMFLPVLQRTHAKGGVFGAFGREKMVGVYAMTAPGQCQLKICEKLRMVPAIFLGNSLSTLIRVTRWTGEWSRRDPSDLHWHLGPVAVDSHIQGQGVGCKMLAAFCAHMNYWSAPSYLETDKSENVRFYQKFGFTLVAEAEVLGVPNWFMSRPAVSAPP
jgi:hypothetical protein